MNPHASLIALLGLASLACAADRWSVVDKDFSTRGLRITAIDGEKVVGVDSSGKTETVPLSAFVQATRDVKIDAPKGLVLAVANGDRLVGQPKAIDGNELVWFAAGIGPVPVPIERAQGVLRDQIDDTQLSADRAEDVLHLANGDVVRGIVTAMADQSVSITPAGGDAIEVPTASVRQLLLATPPGGRPEPRQAKYVVRLTTGSVLSVDQLALHDGQLHLTVAGKKTVEVPDSVVAGIEHTGGPVVWLSARAPTQSVYTPFLDADFPPVMDRTVTGEPLRFNGKTYARGIGAHSRTRLTFPVLEGDKSFRTRYAIDPSLGYADVDIRVLVDDKPVHETKGFKAGRLSELVEADLSGAKTLTLEVDYGAGYDVQDRVMFLEPAIVRK